jgi:L-lactate dehydrogenase complex protein LldG
MILDVFTKKAELANSEVHCFPDQEKALFFVLDFLKREGIADRIGSWAVWVDSPFLLGISKNELIEKVPGLKFTPSKDIAEQAKIGITEMDWAIADTGTLAQDATSIEQRLASSLTEIHIALIHRNRLIPDMVTLLAKLSPREAGYLTFITGPSRTADIERVLTIGVHGPERLLIVFYGGDNGGKS